MIKLIYHSVDKLNDISPFDKEIIELVKENNIKIASPYLNLYYLKKIIRLSKGWKLLTDIDEWVGTATTNKQKENTLNFIRKNHYNIRHFPSLHSKTIITKNTIFLGSANFTDNGIYKNNELSVIINCRNNVIELNKWFDDWWENSDAINIDELDEITKNNPKTNFSTKTKTIYSNTLKIRTKSATSFDDYIGKVTGSVLPITEIEINKYFKHWNNNKWELNFFRLLKNGVKLANLNSESDYLSLTLNKKIQLTFQINNRVVLKSHSKNKKNSIGFILPLKFESLLHKYDNISEVEYFTHRKEKESLLVKFIFNDLEEIDSQIITEWRKAIKQELKRKFKSPYKKYHQDLIYDLAIDEHKLKELFYK